MAVKIRLFRYGAKKRPMYRIVAATSSSPRDGRFLDQIGRYNPLAAKDSDQRLVLSSEKLAHWIQVGAQPTDVVLRLTKDLECMKKFSDRLFDGSKVKKSPKVDKAATK